VAIDFPDDLIAAERAAWQEIQAGALTVDTALAVHEGVSALAGATGLSRIDVEMELKRVVRHPQPEAA
jgi:hypothetical protein